MLAVEEIVDYVKTLKKGFDKELFQSKIDELAHIVDSCGLESEEFHTLFKIWLNLSIPITKWMSLGACLVPQDKIEERSIDYAFRWLMSNYDCGNTVFPRMAFLLDWLTAAMDSNCIDMNALDCGYEIFYFMLSYESLTAHAIKLIYTLTKPNDVTRRRVVELLNLAKKREGKKNMLRQIQVLLGLFKSYKPECVPEDVPAICIHTSFKKVNSTMLARFKRVQEKRNCSGHQREHLLWINPLVSDGAKKALPLVPKLEFTNIGSRQYDMDTQKNCLEFSDPVSVLQHSLPAAPRPAKLRALLLNSTGVALLCSAYHSQHAFLSHELYTLFCNCFLDDSPHSYIEKQDFLHRVAVLQRTLLQGLPVVTRFLAQYLPLWNEKDYFIEILELSEWLDADSPSLVIQIANVLTRTLHRAQPAEQILILRTLTNLYSNLAFTSTRPRRYFLASRPSNTDYTILLREFAAIVSDVCNKQLQVNPGDIRVQYSSVIASESMARVEYLYKVPLGALPRPLTFAAPLLGTSALLVDKMAGLLILYKKIFSSMKSKKIRSDHIYEQRATLEAYTHDFINSLVFEQAFTERKTGFVFNKLHPQLVAKLSDIVTGVDSVYSLRNSLAFSPYTYMHVEAIDTSMATNKLYFDAIIGQTFPNLKEFLTIAVPEFS